MLPRHFKSQWSVTPGTTSRERRGVRSTGRSCANPRQYTCMYQLRTYKLFKSDFYVEPYLLVNMPKCHRAAFAKFRCGVAPLAIETGRYLNLHVNQRVCFNCSTEVEDEQHVFMRCPLYSELRDALFLYVENMYNNFGQMSENDKFNFLFSNGDICSIVAKTCHQMLMCRNSHLYQ